MESVLKDINPVIQMLVVMSVFSLLPFFFTCMTSFLRYAIVFSFLKQALGTQQVPPAIVLLGLSNLENFPMYFFGSVFFFAGLLIGLFAPFFGLIFLFSHGLTGFSLMINALNENLASPVYSDASGYAYVILISLMVSFALLGFIFTIIHNIKINKDNKYRLLLPFIFFFISLFIAALFPELFKILNTVI